MIVIYIILFIASLLFYILYRGVFSFYLFGFMLILPIALNIILSYCRKRVKVSFIDSSSTAGKKEKIPVTIKVESNAVIPIANCIITVSYSNRMINKTERFTVNTPVFQKNAQYLTLNITSEHYGMIDLKITSVKIVDILRLFKRRISLKGSLSESTVLIAPDFFQLSNDIADYGDMGLESESFSKIKKGDDPSEIFDIHEYHDGDKISRIHWKLSAKQDKTMVKDFSLPITNSITIAVNLSMSSDANEDSMTLFDSLIETVSSISMYLTENECPHKVIWFAKEKSDNEISSISDTESCREMINKLLSAPPAGKNNEVLNILNAEHYGKARSGHMIYCTDDYEESVYNKLMDTGAALRYTVLSIQKDPESLTTSYEDGSFTVIPVVAGSIAECIGDLCL